MSHNSNITDTPDTISIDTIYREPKIDITTNSTLPCIFDKSVNKSYQDSSDDECDHVCGSIFELPEYIDIYNELSDCCDYTSHGEDVNLTEIVEHSNIESVSTSTFDSTINSDIDCAQNVQLKHQIVLTTEHIKNIEGNIEETIAQSLRSTRKQREQHMITWKIRQAVTIIAKSENRDNEWIEHTCVTLLDLFGQFDEQIVLNQIAKRRLIYIEKHFKDACRLITVDIVDGHKKVIDQEWFYAIKSTYDSAVNEILSINRARERLLEIATRSDIDNVHEFMIDEYVCNKLSSYVYSISFDDWITLRYEQLDALQLFVSSYSMILNKVYNCLRQMVDNSCYTFN